MLAAPERLATALGVALFGRSSLPEWVLAFAGHVAALETIAPRAIGLYRCGGTFWSADPEKTGAIKTDQTRDVGLTMMEGQGLLPVSQIAIDATWSALRFRCREEIKVLTRA